MPAHYVPDRLLGQGGMAQVYRAYAVSAEGFRRPVALKYVHEGLSSHPEFEAQFRSEAALLALLRHPNIVQVLDFDRDDAGRLFIAMELVEGADLRRVRDFGPLPPPLAVHVVAEVLRGLGYAHDAADEQGRALNLVHRDLSPQNVLVSWQGAIKITDFGIAHGMGGSTTRTGVVKGNAGYMSPEQIEGHTLDARSDLFTVGVLLHELLVGAPLFARPDLPTRSILAQILLDRAAPPSELREGIPDALSAFVMRLLANVPDDRPASAAAALRELLELDLLTSTAPLDFVQHLEAVRRATEKPTVLDEDAPDDVQLPEPVAMSAPLQLHTEGAIVPIEGLEASRPFPWLPLLTGLLAVAVLVLGGLLMFTSPSSDRPEGRVVALPSSVVDAGASAARVDAAAVPALVLQDDAAVPDAAPLDATAASAPKRRRPRRAPAVRRRTPVVPLDAGLVPDVGVRDSGVARKPPPAPSGLVPRQRSRGLVPRQVRRGTPASEPEADAGSH